MMNPDQPAIGVGMVHKALVYDERNDYVGGLTRRKERTLAGILPEG
jgi:hypothetical protein